MALYQYIGVVWSIEGRSEGLVDLHYPYTIFLNYILRDGMIGRPEANRP